MWSAVVLIFSSVVDVWSWLPTLRESQLWNLNSGRECENIKTISFNVLYAPNKSALLEKLRMDYSEMSHGLHPLTCWGRVSLLSALHGLGGGDVWQSTNGLRLSSDYNNGRIQRKHIPLLWVGREEGNDRNISFSLKWLSHFPYCGTKSCKRKRSSSLWFSRKDLNRRLKESYSKNYISRNKAGILFTILQT